MGGVGASPIEQIHGHTADERDENDDDNNGDGGSVRLRRVFRCGVGVGDRCSGFLGRRLLDRSIRWVLVSGDDVDHELDLAGLTRGAIPNQGDRNRTLSLRRRRGNEGTWCDTVRVTKVALGVQVREIIEVQCSRVSGIVL